jgi:hypothetical protein
MDTTTPEAIQQQIDKHNASLKKIRNVAPLVIIFPISSLVTTGIFKKFPDTHSIIYSIAMLVYVSCFVYAYFRHKNKIKKLEKQKQSEN